MLGGGMRQVGVIAAAGLLALKEMPKRLSVDHDNCRFLAEHIAQTPGLSVQLETVQTNIVYFDCSGTTLSAADFVAKLTTAGVLSNATGPTRIRFVTHYDVDKADCEETVRIVKQIAAAHVK
jgi:threonine aldolase